MGGQSKAPTPTGSREWFSVNKAGTFDAFKAEKIEFQLALAVIAAGASRQQDEAIPDALLLDSIVDQLLPPKQSHEVVTT